MRPDIPARDVPLSDGRILRVGVLSDEAGSAVNVILAMGRGEGDAWREDPVEGLNVPLSALAPLRDALTELLEEIAGD